LAGVLAHLGRACQAARESAGLRQIDVATRAGVDDGMVSRFEAGKRVPREIDDLVAAYAIECEAAPYELWLAALDAWQAEQNL
jgi:transcriptional regulator with XRE-family HTH domain